MTLQMKQAILVSSFIFAIPLAMLSQPATASSEFVQGRFVENNPAGPSYHGPGVCRFITGPRDDLGAGRFVLEAGNRFNASVVSLTGSFSAMSTLSGKQIFTLYPDRQAAESYIESGLRQQLRDKYAIFTLGKMEAKVEAGQGQQLICGVEINGRLSQTNRQPRDVDIAFARQGLYDPGSVAPTAIANASATSSTATNVAAAALCPTTDKNNLNASLAPLGLAPVPSKCATPQCLVDFAGYQWWTSFQYYGPQGGYFPNGGYFYNGGLQTPFAPNNASVDQAGMHLKIAAQDLGAGSTKAGSEVVLMFHPDGSEANLGYGDYLVTATVNTAASWAVLDPNAAFGMFTFERVGTGSTGPTTNPHRELDLAEISRWGWSHVGACPFTGSSRPLCEGNTQFTLQPWESNPSNLHRYTIRDGVATVTLVMRWHGQAQPVTFEQYDGAYTFANLPVEPDTKWQTSPAQNEFVPATRCERFHLNFWFGNYNARISPNPPPKTLPQEVLVTNFQFKSFP